MGFYRRMVNCADFDTYKELKMSNYNYKEASTLLKIENVSLNLGGKSILDNVDLEIRDIIQEKCTRGQVRSILGPSGSGKSCLLRLMTGQWEPTSGKIKIAPHCKDDDSTELVSVKPGMIGVVSQHYPLFDHLNLLDNLILAAKKTGISRKDARDKSVQLLTRFELIEHKDKWVHQLSGGQRQRSAILQQVLVGRRFLAMDEPFSGLDPVSLTKVLHLIEELTTENSFNTVVIITHDINAAIRVSDHMHILGRKFDEAGNLVKAAKFVDEINLIDIGLAWRPHKRELPQFVEVLHRVEELFKTKL